MCTEAVLFKSKILQNFENGTLFIWLHPKPMVISNLRPLLGVGAYLEPPSKEVFTKTYLKSKLWKFYRYLKKLKNQV